MGYARHTNCDVKDQLRAGVTRTLPVLLGSFRRCDSGVLFEFAKRAAHCEEPSTEFAFAPSLPHIIYMDDGSTLYAYVRHTVVYVAVDRDEQGRPILERWPIKNYRPYMLDWVRV